MVFAALRKGHRATALSPGSYFDPSSPEQKRRAKERLKHQDLGFGLLDAPSEEGTSGDGAHAAAYAPLNVHDLEQSIHSRFSHQSRASGSSSGERSREAPLSQSLQQELDDFGSLLNRHATEASTHPKVPSKWGSPIKESSKPQLFPTLQLSKRDLLAAANSSHHHRGGMAELLPRHPAPNTAIGTTRNPPQKEKPHHAFLDRPSDGPSQHSRKTFTESSHSRSVPPGDDRKKAKAAPKQATITRRRMTRKSLLSANSSEDEQSQEDSFFAEPSWHGRPRTASEDPSLDSLPHSPHQRSPGQRTAAEERAYASPPQLRSSPPGISAPTPGTSRTTKSYLALEQGDWASLMDTNPLLIKSPEGKLRPTIHNSKQKKDASQPLVTGRNLSGDSSSSDEEDSVFSRNTRDTGIFSEDELELEIYSSDEEEEHDQDPSSTLAPLSTATATEVPDSPEVRRQVARMTSGQLRRWDGFHQQVVALVQVALPDQVGQVAVLMKRFAGREAELIQTLQTMCRRRESTPSYTKKQSVHHSRGLIARTAVTSPRRISAIAGRKIDALARIAAANTLDDQTRAVKPEYVMDDQSFWQNSKSGSSLNGSSLLDEEEDMEESESSYSDEDDGPYGYEEGHRRSAYAEYGDEEEDGYESYEDDDEEGSYDEDEENYEGDDYEQEEEAYTPSDDDDSSASGHPDVQQWR